MIERRKSNKRRSNSNHRRAGSFRSHKTDQSNGGNRPRGSLSKVLEKYMTMAQDANANGDRIVAENYYQYAEHYQRLINQSGEQKKSENNVSNIHEKPANEKPSRTERADFAKKERVKRQDDDVQKDNLNIKEKKADDFTSDGIEALKPFEFSINEKKN